MDEHTSAGERPSVVEHFSIDGLYGYRSVVLDSNYAATVLIAKNGSGKTTLLGAMDAFLRGQFSRLSALPFSQMTCKLRGVDDLLVLTKDDIEQISRVQVGDQLWTAAQAWELEPSALLHYIENDFPDEVSRSDSPVFEKIFAKTGYSNAAAKARCEQIAASLAGRSPNVDSLRKTLREVLSDTEIVYLPTYRRIELSIPDVGDAKRGRRRVSVQSRLGIARGGLYAGDIQFGLSDIAERLATLNQEMLFQSNLGYGEISANIINDLVNGAYERVSPSLEERPTKEALTLFFSRLDERRDNRFVGPYHYGFAQLPDIDRIYRAENISPESTKLLTYFLGKLNSVLQKTQNVENVVEEFIRHCNQYLSGQDASVNIDPTKAQSTSIDDDKILTFNRRDLKVSVVSRTTRRKIPLDALSSGEKQMISLFARLYLYPPKRKLVLIDEPELSLSIDWQRKILVDIVNAPLCSQVIAITHSPFVFDNELEPFAMALKVKSIAPSDSSLFPEDLEESDLGE